MNDYNYQSTKKLIRYPKDGKIAGICEGLGKYFNLDPTIVRIIFIVAGLLAFGGVLAYFLFWLIVPTNDGKSVL